ncbi:hypothetical protein [Paenibacillus aquistagni]|uniref:hypothetical protein n=1 Tax=Paenibacillus aquistagni TaxID=1852522 RepID=UPI001131C083|nr:hypothetical protein [Paenibacillus aquistagni]
MMLTDKQYWELNTRFRTRELEIGEEEDQIKAVHTIDGIEIIVYAYMPKEIVLIYIYKKDDGIQGIMNLHGDWQERSIRLLSFVEPLIRENKITVSGCGVGGSYAVYTAMKMNLPGVVFDAPGHAKLLIDSESNDVGCRNIIAYGSMIPAFGYHPETLVFAERTEHSIEHEDFEFYIDGSVKAVKEHPNPFFRLMSGVNNLIDNPNRVLSELLSEMAVQAGMEDDLDHDMISLYYVLNHLEFERACQLLPELLKQVDRRWAEIYQEYREACRRLCEKGVNKHFEQMLTVVSLDAIEKGARYAEALYASIESILSILLIHELSKHQETIEVDTALPHFAIQISERLDQLSDRIHGTMSKELQQLLANHPIS